MGLTDLLTGDAFLSRMSQKYVGTLLRAVLLGTGVVTARDVNDGLITQLAGALVTIASIAWGLYEKRAARGSLVTALGVAQITEDHANALVANPHVATPSLATPANVVPVPSTA